MTKEEIKGKKHITKIGSSLVLIIDKAFLNGINIKPKDLVEFTIKKVEDNP